MAIRIILLNFIQLRDIYPVVIDAFEEFRSASIVGFCTRVILTKALMQVFDVSNGLVGVSVTCTKYVSYLSCVSKGIIFML